MTDPLSVPVKEAQRLMGIGNTLFYRLVNEGKLDTFMAGNKRLVPYASIKRFVAGEVS